MADQFTKGYEEGWGDCGQEMIEFLEEIRSWIIASPPRAREEIDEKLDKLKGDSKTTPGDTAD